VNYPALKRGASSLYDPPQSAGGLFIPAFIPALNKPGHIELLFFDKQAEATPKNSFLR